MVLMLHVVALSWVCLLLQLTLLTFYLLQGVPLESHSSKLVGSRGSQNRYFDFDKLAEV